MSADRDNKGAEVSISACPPLTAALPSVGGRIKVEPEDFIVEELPAYQPCGEGQHFFLRVEKRDVDARGMTRQLSRCFGVKRRDIGTAGLKDRRAITRQWVSLPAHKIDQAPRPGAVGEGIEILEVSRHRNKLRTGHLEGNRFEVRIRNTELTGEALREAVEQVGKDIRRRGLPNYFGQQRFGNEGSTLQAGMKWLNSGEKPQGRFLQRMGASAVQSEVFNRVLSRRLTEGSWKSVVDGDIFEKTDTGGRFWIDASEREETQRRLDAGEIVVTGPMPGSKQGLADKEAGRLERDVIAGMGLRAGDFAVFGRRGRGTRRAMTVYVEQLNWEFGAQDMVRLTFVLEAGSYATVLLGEFMGREAARS